MTNTERARTRRRRRIFAAAALIATTTVACDTAEHSQAPAATAGNLTNDDVVKLFHAAGQTPAAPKKTRRTTKKHLRRTPVRVNGVPAVWLRPRTLRITMYCYTGSQTASGTWPKTGDVATLDRSIPFGTQLQVAGLGTFTVTDRIGHGSDIDIYSGDRPDCEHRASVFGIQHRLTQQAA